MNTTKARKILKKKASRLNNKELETLLASLSTLADIFIEQQKEIVNVR